MSNALAIGAVTATLRRLIDDGLNKGLNPEGASVTTLPPDLAKVFGGAGDIEGANRVNLFLYHTQLNAAWRNQDLPRQVKPGETAPPPLALDLHYLITAYERDPTATSVVPHRLLGRALGTLHDHPLLGAQEIKAALPGSDLENQIERVRITPHSLSVEELSKLWVIFQTEYRLSAAYQVSLVLIESTRGTKAPLPVLSRGQDDRGVSAEADLIPPFPTLDAVTLPDSQRNATLDTVLTLTGHHLGGNNLAVQASHPRLANAVPLALQAGQTETQIEAKIPNVPSAAPAGLYTVTVKLTKAGETFERTTNALPFALAPEITNSAPGNPIGVVRHADNVTITLDCRPAVLPEQRASLLLGDREVPAPVRAGPVTQLQFVADTPGRPIAGGKYFVRLRVDGVDSELVKYAGDPPKPSFNPDLQITVPA